MRLFTIGPVEMEDDVRILGGKPIPYFRTEEFSHLMLDSDAILQKFMRAGAGAQSVYLTASGTGAMEAAVLNCFSSEDRLLVINGGTFGQRFLDLCHLHGIPCNELRILPGEVLSEADFVPFMNQSFTGLLVNLHETSTGQLYDIRLIADFCRREKLYLLVDAISTFLCDPYDMAGWGIDGTIISSQKGLCIPPGMSIVVLSHRMVERIKRRHLPFLYFDFNLYMENFRRGQTPFTPAVGICLQMNMALRRIEEKGLPNHLQHINDVAQDFRRRIVELPLTLPAYALSNALTPICFKEPIAYRVFEILKDVHGIVLNPTGGIWHDTVLRVAHIGKTEFADNERLVACLEQAIQQAVG